MTNQGTVPEPPEMNRRDDGPEPNGSRALAVRRYAPAVKLGAPLAGVTLLVVAIGWAVFDSSKREDTVVQILRIVLDWPVLGALLALSAGVTFRRELASLINNIAWFKVGPVEGRRMPETQTAPPSAPTPETPAPATVGGPTAASGEGPERGKPPQSTAGEGQVASIDDERDRLVRAAQGWESEAWRWWCEFLSRYLVAKTQFILIWIALSPVPPSKDYYHLMWSAAIPNPLEREAMVSALRHYQLISRDDTALTVELPGGRFIRHMDATHPEWRQAAAASMALRPPPPPPS